MKRLFLASSFAHVASLFPSFAGEKLDGRKVTFIPTASIPEFVKFYVKDDKKALNKLGLQIDELEIHTATNEEISFKLKNNDFIFVSGGNTFFLLQELRRTGADKIIIEQIKSSKLYIGSCAGSNILSPNIEYLKDADDCRKAPDLNDYSALGIIDFYPLPHYNNFPFKKIDNKIISEYGSKIKICTISNSQVILVLGDKVEIKNKYI